MYCKCYWDGNKERVVCKIPITLPTSKARIKRILKEGKDKEYMVPVAPRKESLGEQDYIEWQISYKENERLIEFGLLLKEFYSRGMLSKDEICGIVNATKNEKTFEEIFKIERDINVYEFLNKRYKIIFEKTPILRLELDDGCFIDIALKHKQKAVGYQAMIYLYIPIVSNSLGKQLKGRSAYEKEIIPWYPNNKHVIGLLEAFLIASRTHREDLMNILTNELKIKC